LGKRIEGSGVEPGEAAAELLYAQLAAQQVIPVDVGDLELAAPGWADGLRDLDNPPVIEINAGDRPGRTRLDRLFLDAERPAAVVELHDSVALGIGHGIGEHCRAAALTGCLAQLLHQPVPVENVVAEDQRAGVVADKVAT